MSYIVSQLEKLGIQSRYVRGILKEIVAFDDPIKIEKAMALCLTGLSWYLQSQGLEIDERAEAAKALVRSEPFRKALNRVKELRNG